MASLSSLPVDVKFMILEILFLHDPTGLLNLTSASSDYHTIYFDHKKYFRRALARDTAILLKGVKRWEEEGQKDQPSPQSQIGVTGRG
ncbi:hypothetical protein DRE_00137 [Drechslerella stenobrocha 248]|uniref:Uncharacterized protein n=1 Tax=Drechslerella stenobrocha 248 TaxID=1043628 RepID=W7I9Q8_9PEZI|nr:hypothetical protein DRE_00137 [Drechslerella stenobrocha 248]